MKSFRLKAILKDPRSVVAMILFAITCAFLWISGIVMGDRMTEYQDHRFWSHRFVLEFMHLPIADNEIVQTFRTQYDGLETMILEFDDFAVDDTATLLVTIEDAEGNEYYRYECPTCAFGEKSPFYLVAQPTTPMERGKKYDIHISLDQAGSGITVRAIPPEETHRSLKDLTVGGAKQDTVLYISQEYHSRVPFDKIWITIMSVTAILLLIFWIIPKGYGAKLWNIVGILILTVTAYYCIQELDGKLGTVETKYIITNLFLIFSIFLMFRALLPRASFYISTVLFALIGIVNYYVLCFRGTELLISDIKAFSTAMSVCRNYSFTLTPMIITTIALAACLMIIQCAAQAFLVYGRGWKNWVARACIFAVGAVIFSVIYFGKDVSNFQLFTISTSFEKEGYCYSNLCIWKLAHVEKPFGYSGARLKKIVSSIEEPDPVEGSIIPKNLIVIMNESLSDLEMIGDLQLNKDPLSFIHGLEKNTIKGKLYVDTFGGSTSVTEYEFLTGNTIRFLPIGSNPYANMCRSTEEGLVDLLKTQGYYAVAMHPYGASNWNRDKIYPAYGFDEFIDEKGYEGAQKIRNYVSDRADYDKIIEYLDGFDKEERLFIFNVTMQNHGGYDVNNGAIEKTIEISNIEDRAIAENYLSLINESDHAFEYLTDHFSKSKDPTMIVMFGDHLPRLSDSFFTSLYGKEKAENTPEENNLMYTTPYLIWTNYDSDFEEPKEISANYLGSYMLQCAGLKLTEYNKFLLQMRKKVPAIGMYGIRKADGSFIGYQKLDNELLRDYKILQYMRVQDRNREEYDDIFRLEKRGMKNVDGE